MTVEGTADAGGPPVHAELTRDGVLLRLVLARPKGNVLDRAMLEALRAAVVEHRDRTGLRAILLAAEGKHFSFGASVEEHRPDAVGAMLPAFHGLFRELLACDRVVLAAVRGACLGGGLELASVAHRVFASPDAKLGQPEIKLGVFAPVASLVLPLRLGQSAADDLLLTGRTVEAEEARRIGLVDELADDPEGAALAWFERHLEPLSAAALGHAVRAARHRYRRAVEESLDELEREYLEDLMATHDAREGIEAFLEKRSPTWKHA